MWGVGLLASELGSKAGLVSSGREGGMQPGVRVWKVQEAPEGCPGREGQTPLCGSGAVQVPPEVRAVMTASHRRPSLLPFLKAPLGSCLSRSSALGPSSLVCAVLQVPRLLSTCTSVLRCTPRVPLEARSEQQT